MHPQSSQVTGNKDTLHERFAGHKDVLCSGDLAATLRFDDQ